MEIKFLGTGGAFDYTKGTSSAIVNRNDVTFLIDCGSTVFGQLRTHDLIDKIDYLLLTHLHGDHVGCIFQLIAFRGHYSKQQTKIIYTTEEYKKTIQILLDTQFVKPEYYDFVHIDEVEGVNALDTKGQHVPDMLNFAYYFTDTDELIYYSGDLGCIETTTDFLNTRGEKNITVFHDIMKIEAPSHVYYKDAMEQLSGYTAYGYHCDKATMPEDNMFLLVEDFPELNYGF